MTGGTSPVPVAVIGAGPAGLAAACALRQLGVAVRVLERAPGPPARLPETLYPSAQAELKRLGVPPPPRVPTAVRFLSADGSVAIRMEIEAPRQMAAVDR